MRGMVVKTFRRLYNEFLLTRRSIVEENVSPESTRGAHEAGGRTLHPRGRLVSFPDYFLFSYFLKYSKTEKNYH